MLFNDIKTQFETMREMLKWHTVLMLCYIILIQHTSKYTRIKVSIRGLSK